MSHQNDTSQELKGEGLSWDDDDAVVVGRDDVSDFNDENILPESPAVQDAIRTWLKPTSYGAENGEFRKHLASYLSGTGEWLLSSTTFNQWHDNNNQGMLWIKGIPGSGKSVIAASLVDHLSKEGVPVLYFFFRQIIDANHSPDALLRDWLAQILNYSPPLQARLKEYTEQRRPLSSVSMSDMWQHLRAAMVYLPKVYCVVDALDEMDNDREAFLQALAELGRWRPSRVKVLITSRPVAKVERPLRQEPILQIRLDEKHVDQDIASYVAHRLHQTSKSLSAQKKEVIKQAVPGRANGLFLYAKLAMEAFLEDGTDVEEVLKTLPVDLNVMYSGLLREHARRSGVPHDLQLLILSFVTHASRPLRLLEIAEMIKMVDKTRLEATGGLEAIKDLVRAACGPLLEILPDETVCVIHHSLTEFLNGSTRTQESHETPVDDSSYPVLDLNTTHNRLALCCLSYLHCGCLDKVKLPDDDDYQTDSEWGDSYYVMPTVNKDLRLHYPFLAYSLSNWHVHARKADLSGPLSEELYSSISGLISGSNFQALSVLSENGDTGRSPLHTTAGLGLAQYVSRLIQTENSDVNMVDSSDGTPILQAAGAGHANVVKVLLANGAEPDEPSRRNGKKPLHLAAANDHGEVVNLLLAAGVDPLTQKTIPDPDIMCGDPQRTVGHTPLMYAMRYGQVSAAKAFLPYLNDTQSVSRALAWAARGSSRGGLSSEIMDAILQHPLVDVNAVVRGETPLYLAAKEPDIKSTILLLKAGADPTILSSSQGEEFGRKATRKRNMRTLNRTPLHALCGAGRYHRDAEDEEPESLLECVSLMINSGVDVNAKDEDGMTALHYAAYSWPNLVQALLNAGADVNAVQKGGGTPLHDCSDPENIRILVEEGKADLNKQRESDGKTPFLSASDSWSTALVRVYADLGADLTLRDHDGKGALHTCVSKISHLGPVEQAEAVDTLLAAGIPVNSQDGQGKTALHYLRGLGRDLNMVKRLVAAGADLNARDNQGRTPIFHFVKEAYEFWEFGSVIPALDQLVALGARLDLVDYKGFNLLFTSIEAMNYSNEGVGLIKELIKRGLDATSTDYEGNTLLHEIVARTKDDFCGKLLELPQSLGLDPDQQNHAGQSPLHFMLGPRNSPTTAGFKLFRNFDIKDNDGIRPIHVAARSCELYVHELLSSGASPTEPTKEGVTPLHVAVRFRKSGIVGMLLAAIEAKSGKEGVAAHLNMFHKPSTPTALHWACRSGVPETVALLLAAGADPNATSRKVSSPLRWCVKYEAEEALWKASKVVHDSSQNSPYIPHMSISAKECTHGIKVDELSRQISNGEGMPTRLEDILDMLCAHGADVVTTKGEKGRTNLDMAISRCDSTHDYTIECLVRLRQQLEQEDQHHVVRSGNDEPTEPNATTTGLEAYVSSLIQNHQGLSLDTIHKMAVSIQRRAATRKAFVEVKPWSELWSAESSTKAVKALLDSLLEQHNWDSIRHFLQQESRLLGREDGWMILSKLVGTGCDSIVRGVVTREEINQLQTERENGLQLAKAQGKKCMTDSLLKSHPLIDACGRSSGNMPMLRCLVEDLGVDINDSRYSWPSYRPEQKQYQPNITAVGKCCKGEDWWQVAEALPYLIKHGADLERRNGFGRTTLLWALGMCSSIYKVQVVRTLVEAGADVNAIDNEGRNCLSHAGNNIELTTLLIKHGAAGSIGALANAIESSNLAVVEALLDAGTDPNGFQAPPEGRPFVKGSRAKANKLELPPVFLAAMDQGTSVYESDNLSWKSRLPIIQMLLEKGADPLAAFIKRNETEGDDSMEETVVLHQILYQGAISQPFLDLPDLQLEHRDSKGRTLLLSACGSKQDPDIASCDAHYNWSARNINRVKTRESRRQQGPTIIEVLLERGACITARDDEQRNALHQILRVQSFSGYESLHLLLSKAPGLLHQTDAVGETPLHYALRRVASLGNARMHIDTRAIEILLEAGADPHQPDANGNSALHQLAKWLASQGRIYGEVDKPREVFKHFVSLGIPINGRNNKGETPAFSFMRQQTEYYPDVGEDEQTKALQILADAGADFLAVNDGGQTLLHVVAGTDQSLWKQYRHQMELLLVHRFQWLLEQGIDPMAEDINHRTCLDVAAAKENNDIVAMFKRLA